MRAAYAFATARQAVSHQAAKNAGCADSYPFRQPGEVRLTLMIAPDKATEMGSE